MAPTNFEPKNRDVTVRVYDISNGKVKRWAPWLIGRRHNIDGIWHTGIQVYGWEYFYGGCGIEKMLPSDVEKELPMVLETTIPLGPTKLTQSEFEKWILTIQPFFGPKQYDLIKWNCNSFTDFIVRKLVPASDGIPLYISHIVSEVEKSSRGRAIIRVLRSVGNLLDPTNATHPTCDCNDCDKHAAVDLSALDKNDLDMIERTKMRFAPQLSERAPSLLDMCSKVPQAEWSCSEESEWELYARAPHGRGNTSHSRNSSHSSSNECAPEVFNDRNDTRGASLTNALLKDVVSDTVSVNAPHCGTRARTTHHEDSIKRAATPATLAPQPSASHTPHRSPFDPAWSYDRTTDNAPIVRHISSYRSTQEHRLGSVSHTASMERSVPYSNHVTFHPMSIRTRGLPKTISSRQLSSSSRNQEVLTSGSVRIAPFASTRSNMRSVSTPMVLSPLQ